MPGGPDNFYGAARKGNLPAVSFVDPALGLELIDGLSGDYHPHGDIRNGEAFLNSIYQAITNGPSWSRTVMIITFDEWGGFFDHVAPATAPDTNPALTGLRGFRVPSVVISPFAPRGGVDHGIYDHTSILKLIEWRWGLSPLTPRDAAANNLAGVLDFVTPPTLTAPQWQVDEVTVLPCLISDLWGPQPLGEMASASVVFAPRAVSSSEGKWLTLAKSAAQSGWQLPVAR